jgi:hypothetical protein
VPDDKGGIQKVPWRLDGVGRLAWSSPAALVDFETARKALLAGLDLPEHKGQHFAGIGYVLPEGDHSQRLVCLDLDNCIVGDGEVTSGAQKIIDNFRGYIEKSPSGKGLHIWVLATIPADFKNINKRDGNEPLYVDGQKVEVFVRKHFVTVTNDVFREGQPEDRTAKVLELYAMKPKTVHTVEPTRKPVNEGGDKIKHYCQKALEMAAKELRQASEGNRNNALNETAYSMGRYVGGGWLARSEVESQLMRAARETGLSDAEIIATLNSGIEAGILEPKTPEIDVEPVRDGSKPRVLVGTDIIATIKDTLDILYKNNHPPRIMQRAGMLVRVRETGKNVYKIEELTDYALRNEMGQHAIFEKPGGKECAPPIDTARSILALEKWDFPMIIGLVTSPVARPDGSILLAPGYDTATALFYIPSPGLEIPEIDSSQGAAREAASCFMREVLHDFPFVDEASRANALAAFLTPIIRPMIQGCVPMALIDKPAPGTGASKLLDLMSIIATGKPMAAMSPPKDEDEWRKVITGIMRDGSQMVCWDNIVSDLEAPTLARCLSSSIWKDRTLGKPDAVEYPQRTCMYATGNNLTLNGDIPRRSYLIQLDAKMARPWERRPDNFRHPDINGWVKENRGVLLSKLLTMVRAWAEAGRPAGGCPVVGGFDEWVNIVGGILRFAGVDGFLGNLTKLYEEIDVGGDEWEEFLRAWYDIHKDAPVTAYLLLLELENENSPLSAAMPSDIADKIRFKGPGNTKKVGRCLRKKAGVRFNNGLMLCQEKDTHANTLLWRVVKTENQTLV